jgi:hypothetical protein
MPIKQPEPGANEKDRSSRPMDTLKLAALDEEDLAVVSACVQDAVLKVGDVDWRPREKRLLVNLRRFCWESGAAPRQNFERHLACLHFARVERVKSCNIRRDDPDAVLSLLALRFEPGEAPGGTVSLLFSGGGELRAEVECLEVGLTDLGAAWATERRPEHALD